MDMLECQLQKIFEPELPRADLLKILIMSLSSIAGDLDMTIFWRFTNKKREKANTRRMKTVETKKTTRSFHMNITK